MRKKKKGEAPAEPHGTLTQAQHEILEVIWSGQDPDPEGESLAPGKSVKEIWQAISAQRDLTKTTILNQVARLEARGWVERTRVGATSHYRAVYTREQVHERLAGEFVEHFFGGSASHLVQSLLGGGELVKSDLEHLRAIVNDALEGKNARRSRRKS